MVGDGDRLHAGEAVRGQKAVDRAEVGRVLLEADRLEHLDRRDLGEGALQRAVVLEEDLHAVAETRGADALGGQRVLLVRDRHTGDAAARGGRGVDREAAPAAADLQHVVVGAELELLADAPQLVLLRPLERLARVLPDGT